MIKVLNNWLEIGEANKFLNKKRLPKHPTPEKNRDLYQLYNIIEFMPRNIRIIDLGCGELHVLKFLYALGFKNLYGVDLLIGWKERLVQLIKMLKEHSLSPPFHLFKGNITKTKFPAQFFDLGICISTIEHGVNLEEFLNESYRILKIGGLLFITTDYWEEDINIVNNNKPFGLSWKVFSKKDIKQFIELSYDIGFSLYKNSSIPNCSEQCVIWNNQEYTFICIVLKKEKK